MLSDVELITILKEWTQKLGLPTERFQFFKDYEHNENKHGSIGRIGYNPPTDRIGIELQKSANKRVVIHELGHEHFRNSIGLTLDYLICNDVNEQLFLTIDAIEDLFINIMLSYKFQEYYQLYLSELLNDMKSYIVRKMKPFEVYYVFFYLPTFCNYALTNEDKTKYGNLFKAYINATIKDNKAENKNNLLVSEKKLQLISKFGLKNYIKIKSQESYLSFLTTILNLSGLFSREEIQKNINILYGIK